MFVGFRANPAHCRTRALDITAGRLRPLAIIRRRKQLSSHARERAGSLAQDSETVVDSRLPFARELEFVALAKDSTGEIVHGKAVYDSVRQRAGQFFDGTMRMRIRRVHRPSSARDSCFFRGWTSFNQPVKRPDDDRR